MDWLARMNRAMDYIEMNLTEDIALVEVARKLAVRHISSKKCSHSLRM